jgi:uncharacterized membrane protein
MPATAMDRVDLEDAAMTTTADGLVPVFPTLPLVRRVRPDAPWTWLVAGWNDFLASWPTSVIYGGIWVGCSYALAALLFGTDSLALLLPLAAGFLLVAPLLAVGLYEISRRRATGQPATLLDSLLAWRRRPLNIAGLGLILVLVQLAWVRVALLLYALFFAGNGPGFDSLWPLQFQTPLGIAFLVTGTLIGGVLALIVFAIAAVSLPMLIDRDVDLFTAMATSVSAVRENPRPMLLWAGLIVFMMGLGIGSLFLGLAVTLPLLGHATWHAYRDLVA